ncbi:hypothetical protein SUDANB70_03611 [Streptomyces sp. enrichment culture]
MRNLHLPVPPPMPLPSVPAPGRPPTSVLPPPTSVPRSPTSVPRPPDLASPHRIPVPSPAHGTPRAIRVRRSPR